MTTTSIPGIVLALATQETLAWAALQVPPHLVPPPWRGSLLLHFTDQGANLASLPGCAVHCLCPWAGDLAFLSLSVPDLGLALLLLLASCSDFLLNCWCPLEGGVCCGFTLGHFRASESETRELSPSPTLSTWPSSCSPPQRWETAPKDFH